MSKYHALLLVGLAVFRALGSFVTPAYGAGSVDPLPDPLQGHGYAQIGLQVSDLDRSVYFYNKVLGLKLLFSASGMVFFQAGEARLMIEHGNPGRSTTIYFDDANLERDKPLLEAKGVKFFGPVQTVQRTADYDLKLLDFSDPDGNPLALMGKVRRKNGPGTSDGSQR
jgi:catechol 2,3-dioxygenase-like lactoylglutathione lyase family enzyme